MTKEGSYEEVAMSSHETCMAKLLGKPGALEGQAMTHVDSTPSSAPFVPASEEEDERGVLLSKAHDVEPDAKDLRKEDDSSQTLPVRSGRSLRDAAGSTSRRSKIKPCIVYCVTRGRSRHHCTRRSSILRRKYATFWRGKWYGTT